MMASNIHPEHPELHTNVFDVGIWNAVRKYNLQTRLDAIYNRLLPHVELLEEIFFDPNSKYSYSDFEMPKTKSFWRYFKGAPDILLSKCTLALKDDKLVPLTLQIRKDMMSSIQQLCSDGYRLLGFAQAKLEMKDKANLSEVDCTFIGFMSFSDEIRDGMFDSVQFLKDNEISLKIATGDHPATAVSVGKKIRLFEGKPITNTLELLSGMNKPWKIF
jgi:magnesium-transporting ATPase (P-type)